MDKKIPFGKFKGKNYKFLLDSRHREYCVWLLEDCQTTLVYHPEFHQFLKEQFVADYVKREEAFTERKGSKYIQLDGVLISNFVEYRELISKVYSGNWKNSSKVDLYETFGEPESYPFIAIFFQNTLCAFNVKELCKVYPKEKPSLRYYSESMY